jgi:hypothetical protein
MNEWIGSEVLFRHLCRIDQQLALVDESDRCLVDRNFLVEGLALNLSDGFGRSFGGT